jgi:hypothetical protein
MTEVTRWCGSHVYRKENELPLPCPRGQQNSSGGMTVSFISRGCGQAGSRSGRGTSDGLEEESMTNEQQQQYRLSLSFCHRRNFDHHVYAKTSRKQTVPERKWKTGDRGPVVLRTETVVLAQPCAPVYQLSHGTSSKQ